MPFLFYAFLEKYHFSDFMPSSVNRVKARFNDPSLGTTVGTCSTCHLENGTKANPEQMMGFTIKAFDNSG